MLRRVPLPSNSHYLQNDMLQPPAQTPTAAIPTSVAIDSEWIVIGLANSRIHIFSARTGVSCRTLVGHSSGVWAVALVKAGGQPLEVPEQGPQVPQSRAGTPDAAQATPKPRHDRLSPSMRGALGLDAPTGSRSFRRRSIPTVVRDVEPEIPHKASSPYTPPGKPSDPSGTSEGWGQPNALVVSGGCDKDLRVWDVKSGYVLE